MANKICNALHDQIPHIVLNHPDTDPEHWAIMLCLYKRLKDETRIQYSNATIAKNSRVSLRAVERKVPELVKMGILRAEGRSYARRFSLGYLFDTSAK